MFESQDPLRNSSSIAYLAFAFVCSPAILALSRPFGYLTLASAIGCSTLCAALGWANWNPSSLQPALESTSTR
jgi:hypothetical protein